MKNDWEREFRILVFDKLNDASGHTGEYLARLVKSIIDNLNITYKINSFILDLAVII